MTTTINTNKIKDIILYGIDLGTTNCSLSELNANGKVGDIQFNSDKQLPSYVYYDKDKSSITVGKTAKSKLTSEKESSNVIFDCKRFLGLTVDKKMYEKIKETHPTFADKIKYDNKSNSIYFDFGKRRFTPIEVCAEFLREIKQKIESYKKKYKIIVTKPAMFSEQEAHETREAILNAGFENDNFIKVIF